MAHKYEVSFRFPRDRHGQYEHIITGVDIWAWSAGYVLHRALGDCDGNENTTFLLDDEPYPRRIVSEHLRAQLLSEHPEAWPDLNTPPDPLKVRKEEHHGQI